MSHLNVSVEGPYGPDSSFLSRYEMIVMVGGGSGIAPFISIIRWILFKANTEGGKAQRVVLICSFKKCIDLTMIDLLMSVSGTAFDISRLQLQIEAYVTSEKQPAITERKPLQTSLFKSNASDEPISAVLGRNSWLCLGIIISLSFILFILLIAILNKYYIYPIDHNSDLKFPYFSKASLNMLFICVSIVIAATSVFMWNKKQNKYINQTESVRTTAPSTSPGSVCYDADKELELLPHQSFVHAVKVHYGKRPDIKRMCE
ncbi:hypothetical protein PIB30_057401 [Stylosanthes scabra]|uniref:Ferric reductase NAD binding domain-containing protein n=1 Tax=Stylosanthes scabra TaxID=79078 RepID=A0ABU6WI64_9FABA|nr:hypothetical protein [Stylosanthes scabra]